ncbi:MAG: AMP-binding protein, partial [Porticoccaceae bacterium]|nr:AMP-binding protein [Porticoccaceae bacterium]
MLTTYTDYLNQWNTQHPNQVWLRERSGDSTTDWTWSQSHTEINAMACWFESRFASSGHSVGLLSRNRAHWYFADLGACAAGHVVVPIFTTAPGEIAEYVMDFTDMKVLFVGGTENWDQVQHVLPEGILLIALPGVE